MNVRRRAAAPVMWVLGPSFRTQYLPAWRARGRRVAYDPDQAWSARYRQVLADSALNDAATVSRGANPQLVLYHYNAVENALLEHAMRHPLPAGAAVLDVGAGAGHWVDFYRTALGAGDVVGLEISPPAAEQLGAHYAGDPRVSIVRGDVTDEAFAIDRRFDVINAVDVLFHIVADDRWQRALRNLAALLAPGGRVVIVEHVGLVSHDAGLRRPSTARGDRAGLDPERPAIVTKRVRSLREWRSGAGDAGLELFDSVRLRKRRTLATPANRMLAFRQVEA